jgi:hypothetical protein
MVRARKSQLHWQFSVEYLIHTADSTGTHVHTFYHSNRQAILTDRQHRRACAHILSFEQASNTHRQTAQAHTYTHSIIRTGKQYSQTDSTGEHVHTFYHSNRQATLTDRQHRHTRTPIIRTGKHYSRMNIYIYIYSIHQPNITRLMHMCNQCV